MQGALMKKGLNFKALFLTILMLVGLNSDGLTSYRTSFEGDALLPFSPADSPRPSVPAEELGLITDAGRRLFTQCNDAGDGLEVARQNVDANHYIQALDIAVFERGLPWKINAAKFVISQAISWYFAISFAGPFLVALTGGDILPEDSWKLIMSASILSAIPIIGLVNYALENLLIFGEEKILSLIALCTISGPEERMKWIRQKSWDSFSQPVELSAATIPLEPRIFTTTWAETFAKLGFYTVVAIKTAFGGVLFFGIENDNGNRIFAEEHILGVMGVLALLELPAKEIIDSIAATLKGEHNDHLKRLALKNSCAKLRKVLNNDPQFITQAYTIQKGGAARIGGLLVRKTTTFSTEVTTIIDSLGKSHNRAVYLTAPSSANAAADEEINLAQATAAENTDLKFTAEGKANLGKYTDYSLLKAWVDRLGCVVLGLGFAGEFVTIQGVFNTFGIQDSRYATLMSTIAAGTYTSTSLLFHYLLVYKFMLGWSETLRDGLKTIFSCFYPERRPWNWQFSTVGVASVLTGGVGTIYATGMGAWVSMVEYTAGLHFVPGPLSFQQLLLIAAALEQTAFYSMVFEKGLQNVVDDFLFFVHWVVDKYKPRWVGPTLRAAYVRHYLNILEKNIDRLDNATVSNLLALTLYIA